MTMNPSTVERTHPDQFDLFGLALCAASTAIPTRRAQAPPHTGWRPSPSAPTYAARLEMASSLPPTRTRAIIVAGCGGLAQLARQFRRPMHLITSCHPDEVWVTLNMLRRIAYGARHESSMHLEKGWEDWFPMKLASDTMTRDHDAVHRGSHELQVTLPDYISDEEFDRAFFLQIRSHAVDLWSATTAGGNHCRQLDLEPACLRRMAGRADRVSLEALPVRELVPFQPGNLQDMRWLEGIARSIISATPTARAA